MKEQGLDTSGLTETSNFGLPLGSLDTGSPLEPFDWSAAPALDPPHPKQEPPHPKQDPSSEWPVPEELITCQRDPPEPSRVTPSRLGYAYQLHSQSACMAWKNSSKYDFAQQLYCSVKVTKCDLACCMQTAVLVNTLMIWPGGGVGGAEASPRCFGVLCLVCVLLGCILVRDGGWGGGVLGGDGRAEPSTCCFGVLPAVTCAPKPCVADR